MKQPAWRTLKIAKLFHLQVRSLVQVYVPAEPLPERPQLPTMVW
jgi:hypothetical protein